MVITKNTFKPEFSYTLERANYVNNLPHSAMNTAEVHLLDTIQVTNATKEELLIRCARRMWLNQEKNIEIEVSFLITLNLCSGFKDEVEPEEWRVALLEHCDNQYFTQIYSRIALTIAQLTSAYGQIPLVTPPNFLKINKDPQSDEG